MLKHFFKKIKKQDNQTTFADWACALRLDKEHVTSDSDSGA